ncbi:MAG: hypothetical protein K2P76_06010 [Lachnospiraceae bacterium]|nr:hypothetical protein [Lachnospiraceae bacterium]MDE6981970.1 hypothetical protein [Lachnospiraceae bacterium]
MKQKIETIPLIKAFEEKDECPFCCLERQAEQHALSFILGSAYMEDDIREQTDKTGFCRHHYKMMYDYGNRLGSALILSTHMKKLNQEMAGEFKKFSPGKSSLKSKFQKTDVSKEPKTSIGQWVTEKEHSCYVCHHFNDIYNRYLETFIDLYKKDGDFRSLFFESKGFCLPHFRDLVETADAKLSDKEKETFFPKVFSIMLENMERVQEDVSWFVQKNDYLNKDKPWGNSTDSIQRAMQKCAGGYPADPVFQQKP